MQIANNQRNRFTEFAKIYGPIFSLKVGSGTMVVFNSAKPAIEVMDKQSLLSSNRPPSYILAQRVFRGNHPMYMAPADRWKLRRKLYHQVLQESVVNKIQVPIVEAESWQLIRDICSKPKDLMLHPGRYSNSVTMSLGKRKKCLCAPKSIWLTLCSSLWHTDPVSQHIPLPEAPSAYDQASLVRRDRSHAAH